MRSRQRQQPSRAYAQFILSPTVLATVAEETIRSPNRESGKSSAAVVAADGVLKLAELVGGVNREEFNATHFREIFEMFQPQCLTKRRMMRATSVNPGSGRQLEVWPRSP